MVTELAGLEVCSADDLGIELAVQVGQNEAEHVALAEHQAAGEDVRPVAEFSDSGLDPLARLGVDDVAAV